MQKGNAKDLVLAYNNCTGKGKCIAVCETSPHRYGKSQWSHMVGDFPAFTPAEASTRFSDPKGMQGWVDLGTMVPTNNNGKFYRLFKCRLVSVELLRYNIVDERKPSTDVLSGPLTEILVQ